MATLSAYRAGITEKLSTSRIHSAPALDSVGEIGDLRYETSARLFGDDLVELGIFQGRRRILDSEQELGFKPLIDFID